MKYARVARSMKKHNTICIATRCIKFPVWETYLIWLDFYAVVFFWCQEPRVLHEIILYIDFQAVFGPSGPFFFSLFSSYLQERFILVQECLRHGWSLWSMLAQNVGNSLARVGPAVSCWNCLLISPLSAWHVYNKSLYSVSLLYKSVNIKVLWSSEWSPAYS